MKVTLAASRGHFHTARATCWQAAAAAPRAPHAARPGRPGKATRNRARLCARRALWLRAAGASAPLSAEARPARCHVRLAPAGGARAVRPGQPQRPHWKWRRGAPWRQVKWLLTSAVRLAQRTASLCLPAGAAAALRAAPDLRLAARRAASGSALPDRASRSFLTLLKDGSTPLPPAAARHLTPPPQANGPACSGVTWGERASHRGRAALPDVTSVSQVYFRLGVRGAREVCQAGRPGSGHAGAGRRVGLWGRHWGLARAQRRARWEREYGSGLGRKRMRARGAAQT